MAKTLRIIIVILFVSGKLLGQSTYEDVRGILSSKCSTTCHGKNTYSFNISDPANVLYDSLINAKPLNAYAVLNKYALISPGYPDRSYLLRKVANCISADLALHTSEGAAMPENEAPLAIEEIELIRQWILFGAPDTGVVVNRSLIDTYYQGSNQPRVVRPTPPKSCEGFQIHFGPIFYDAREETEYYYRYDLNLTDTIEVIAFQLEFNAESHHFGINKYLNNTASLRPQGLILESVDETLPGDRVFVGFSQKNKSSLLPNGTAYFIDQNESLDLNFHLFNPHTEILVAEAYVNVYTQPKGSAEVELKSAILHNFNIDIPNDSQSVTFTYDLPVENVSIASLFSHTHKHATDFDVYLRNDNGTKGKMIYNGSYNYLQGFDTGVYDWEHPPIAYFEPFLDLSQPINNGAVPKGLIMEATYYNAGPGSVFFGVTTLDEMMAILIQYVDSPYTIPANPPYIPLCIEPYIDPCLKDTIIGTEAVTSLTPSLSIYPNPTVASTTIKYSLQASSNTVKADIVNLLGQVVAEVVTNDNQPAGEYSYEVNLANQSDGIYIFRLSVNGRTVAKRLIVSRN